ncbi:protein of unknown function [Rhodovastum atsumiense]|nr:protein of unknown function [Rhodovastum atsumiense]
MSLVLANSTTVFATATGSFDHASAVGPFSSGLTPSNRVPSKASAASRFFATLYVAPAARIRRRRSVASATVNPLGWVTTTRDVSAKTDASEATNACFSVRSKTRLLFGLMRVDRIRPGCPMGRPDTQKRADRPRSPAHAEPPGLRARWPSSHGFPVSRARAEAP